MGKKEWENDATNKWKRRERKRTKKETGTTRAREGRGRSKKLGETINERDRQTDINMSINYIIKWVASNKSSLLLRILLHNTQTVQLI